MISVPSENILKLRSLFNDLTIINPSNVKNNMSEDITYEIKKIVDKNIQEIETKKTYKEKIICYENLCSEITNVLEK